MRLWSIHPRYLDPKGLVALWREALEAHAVPEANPVFVVVEGSIEPWERVGERDAATPLL